jgi:hypothetical protein
MFLFIVHIYGVYHTGGGAFQFHLISALLHTSPKRIKDHIIIKTISSESSSSPRCPGPSGFGFRPLFVGGQRRRPGHVVGSESPHSKSLSSALFLLFLSLHTSSAPHPPRTLGSRHFLSTSKCTFAGASDGSSCSLYSPVNLCNAKPKWPRSRVVCSCGLNQRGLAPSLSPAPGACAGLC